MTEKTLWHWNREMPLFMASENITIVVSSYQANIVLAFGLDNQGKIAPYGLPLARAMGMGRHKDQLYLSNNGQLIVYRSNGPGYDSSLGKFTDEYYAQYAYCGGDVDIHDIRPTSEGVYYISAKFNCIAKPSLRDTFEAYWVPPWITPGDDGQLKAEDRCHLNGLCCIDGKPKYVTSASRGDILGHWREHKKEGVVYDVVENKVVCEKVYSPHSPQWFRDKLWILESGTGYFGYVDLDEKKFVRKVFLPGFLRGLTFHGKYALIGLSLDRHDVAFDDLPLSDTLMVKGQKAISGVRIIDMDSMSVIHELSFTPDWGVREIYDIVCLPGHRTRILSTGGAETIKQFGKIMDPRHKDHQSHPDSIFDTTACKDPQKYLKPDIEELKKIKGFEDIKNSAENSSNLLQIDIALKSNQLKKKEEEEEKRQEQQEKNEDPYFNPEWENLMTPVDF